MTILPIGRTIHVPTVIGHQKSVTKLQLNVIYIKGMEKLIILFYLMIGVAGNIQLNAQVDTIYNLGNFKNRISLSELKEKIAKKEALMKNDSLEWVVRFEVSHEKLEKDTLIQFGTIAIIAQSLLSDKEKVAIRLNKEIPQFNYEDLEGDSIGSANLKGKVLLINFWFTKCPPCIAEMPYLNELKEDYKEQMIDFVSMAPEGKPQIINFLKKYDFQFRHIPNASGFLKKFGVVFPRNILVDKNGIIRYIGGGIVTGMIEDGNEGIIERHQIVWDELRGQIDKLLNE